MRAKTTKGKFQTKEDHKIGVVFSTQREITVQDIKNNIEKNSKNLTENLYEFLKNFEKSKGTKGFVKINKQAEKTDILRYSPNLARNKEEKKSFKTINALKGYRNKLLKISSKLNEFSPCFSISPVASEDRKADNALKLSEIFTQYQNRSCLSSPKTNLRIKNNSKGKNLKYKNSKLSPKNEKMIENSPYNDSSSNGNLPFVFQKKKNERLYTQNKLKK